MIGFLLAAAILVLDALSILDVFNSAKDTEKKALWIVLILLLPLAGPLLYFILTRRGPLSRIG